MHVATPCCTLRDWIPGRSRFPIRHADNLRIVATRRDAFPYTRKDAQRFISKATGHTPDLFLAIDVNREAVGGMGYPPAG